jgi:hypothetical protein
MRRRTPWIRENYRSISGDQLVTLNLSTIARDLKPWMYTAAAFMAFVILAHILDGK